MGMESEPISDSAFRLDSQSVPEDRKQRERAEEKKMSEQ